MKLAKCIGYKLIVSMCLVLTLCAFVASAPVEASKVNNSDFYYSGTQKGSYSVEKDFIDKLVESLGAILDYLLGLCTMGIRMVFIGWTALFERCLTWIFKGATGEEVVVSEVSSTNLIGSDDWITIDAIVFNQVPLLDVNVFNFEGIKGYDATGSKIEETEGETPTPDDTDDDESLVIIFKKTIAGWYYTFRLLSIMVMLILLVYIGIQIAIKSSATDKAMYKKMLTDWIAGMVLVFCIHYVILAIIQFNEILVTEISNLRKGSSTLAVYEYGLEERATKPLTNEELEFTLYDEVKTRAYDFKMTVGTTGMIMYMVLVYYAWKYAFIYLKRYLSVAVLVIIAPLVAVSYAFNKVQSGKAAIFSKWLKEIFFIVMLQSIHALIYTMFVQTALGMSLASISAFILVLVLLNFMSKAEDLFRRIFNIKGDLTDDIAHGKGIKQTLEGLKAAIGVMAVGKVAKNYTKGVAKIMTKPLTGAATAAFTGAMKQRAKNLDEKAKNFNDLHYGNVRDYSELKKALRNKRTNALKFGNLRNQIENGEINLDELEESVNSLKLGESLYDENGSMIGVVDEKYIDSKRSELEQLRGIENWSDEERDYWMSEYESLHDKKGNLKKLRIYAGDKWADIMDPTKYIQEVEDENGNVQYKKIETKREYGKFGKKTDSVGKRLASQLTWDNISGLNKEEKEALKAQKELIKNQIFGFAGLLAGIPLTVVEPAAGMALMSVGISNTSKVFSGSGKRNEKNLRKFKMDSAGRYTFKGFEGKSEYTMAEGAKAMARAQVQDIVNAKAQQEASMKARMETKHKNLTAALKLSANTGKAFQFATIGTIGAVGGAPTFVAALGAAGSVKLTGSLLNRFGDNAWARYQASMRAAAKANGKAFEKAEKNAKTENYLELFADQYLQLEEQQYKKEFDRHAELFGNEYAEALKEMHSQIDKKTSAELLRDVGYEDAIEAERTSDGKIKISKDAENQLIDNALIDYAQKSGLMDVTKINIEEKQDQIVSMLTTQLVTKGIINRDETANDVFENVTKVMKDRQAKFTGDDRGKRAVEEKIAGDAIVKIMKEKGITDPTQVSEKEAIERYYVDYNSSSTNSTNQTSSVLGELNAQKGDGSQSFTTVDSILSATRATQAIQSRKSIFSQKSRKTVGESAANAMRETLKRKNELSLNSAILGTEDDLLTSQSQGVNNNVGLDSSKDGSLEFVYNDSDNVLKMLQLQTQLHKDKQKIEYVQNRRKSKETKVKAIQ